MTCQLFKTKYCPSWPLVQSIISRHPSWNLFCIFSWHPSFSRGFTKSFGARIRSPSMERQVPYATFNLARSIPFCYTTTNYLVRSHQKLSCRHFFLRLPTKQNFCPITANSIPPSSVSAIDSPRVAGLLRTSTETNATKDELYCPPISSSPSKQQTMTRPNSDALPFPHRPMPPPPLVLASSRRRIGSRTTMTDCSNTKASYYVGSTHRNMSLVKVPKTQINLCKKEMVPTTISVPSSCSRNNKTRSPVGSPTSCSKTTKKKKAAAAKRNKKPRTKWLPPLDHPRSKGQLFYVVPRPDWYYEHGNSHILATMTVSATAAVRP